MAGGDGLFSPQIPLQLEPRRHGRFDTFVAGPNGAAVQAVRAAVGEAGAIVFLHGADSSGKTHLLNAACHAARSSGLTAFYLGLRRLPMGGVDSLQGLEAMDLVCIDDLHRVAGDPAWEEGLFHFINRVRERKGRLVVASAERLSALPLELPDLRSRLAWGLRVELQPLDDEAKLAVMHAHAAALGIELPDDVASYLLRHGKRGAGSLVAAVERLQHAAFTAKRRITIHLARRILGEL